MQGKYGRLPVTVTEGAATALILGEKAPDGKFGSKCYGSPNPVSYVKCGWEKKDGFENKETGER